MKDDGATLCCLSSHAEHSLFDYKAQGSMVYILGNETEGVSRNLEKRCNARLRIPMHNGVESLNVAVTAALIAFSGI
jgi:23S rRNA (guanosine2251-2'-O)-methyltransferase